MREHKFIFNYEDATIIDISNGLINRIYIEGKDKGIDDQGRISLKTSGSAIIELNDGSKIFIENSEWCNLYIL